MNKTSKSIRINPKKLIVDYIDSLINRVDIYTEEMLAEYSETDMLQFKIRNMPFDGYKVPFKNDSTFDRKLYENPYYGELNMEIKSKNQFDESGLIRVWDYLNSTRDKMIKRLNEVLEETFRQVESLKNDIELNGWWKNGVEATPQVIERLFSKKFPFLIEINGFSAKIKKKKTCLNLNTNNHPFMFSLYLVELDFFITDEDVNFLRKSLSNFVKESLIYANGKTAVKTKLYEKIEFKEPIFVNYRTLRVYMLCRYLEIYLNTIDNHPSDKLLQINQNDLESKSSYLSIELDTTIIELGFHSQQTNRFIFGEKFTENIKALHLTMGTYSTYPDKMSKIEHLAGLPNLEHLKIVYYELFSTSFVGLTRLKCLYLDKCDLSSFNSDSFRYCTNIEILSLDGLENFSFLDLSHLIHLKSLNVITFDSLGIFKTVSPDLETLDLSFIIENTNMDEFPEVIRRFKNLKALSLYNCKLPKFDINWLANPSILEYLMIYDCIIKTINLKVGSRLTIGRTDNNFIEITQPKCLDNLRELNIATKVCKTFLLENLPNLTKIKFHRKMIDNGITVIPKDMFSFYTTLTSLDLSYNEIEYLEDNIFSVLNNLETFNLESNELSEVREAAFGGLEKLKHLNISKNPIREIKLSCLVNLEYLIMESCDMSRVNQETFSGLTNLTHLDLKNSPIRIIDPNVFMNLKNLKEVRLNYEQAQILKLIYQDRINICSWF